MRKLDVKLRPRFARYIIDCRLLKYYEANEWCTVIVEIKRRVTRLLTSEKLHGSRSYTIVATRHLCCAH